MRRWSIFEGIELRAWISWDDLFTKGRVKFGVLRPNRRQVAASHPSALICWNVDVEPLRHLGMVVMPNLKREETKP